MTIYGCAKQVFPLWSNYLDRDKSDYVLFQYIGMISTNDKFTETI